MTQPVDPACFDAFVRLLALPDPDDLPRRRHVIRCQGDPDRRGTRLPGLLMAWMQRRHLEVDIEEPAAPAIQAQARHARPSHAGLRIVGRTAAG